MSHIIEVALTDAEYDDIAAEVPDVDAYLQGQVDTIASQFAEKAKAAAFERAGLSPALATAGLDADQEAFLIADASAKKAQADAAAANLKP